MSSPPKLNYTKFKKKKITYPGKVLPKKSEWYYNKKYKLLYVLKTINDQYYLNKQFFK